MQNPLANPDDLEHPTWLPLDGTRASGEVFVGPLLLESDAGGETDYILLELDTDGSSYILLEATP